MEFDLDQTLQSLAPWDLTIRYKGEKHVTERPSIGLIAQMSGVKSASEENFGILQQMFAEPRPALSGWAPEAILAAHARYLAYFNSITKKNCQAAAAAGLAVEETGK
jgi:hypothetical protein